MNRKNGMRKVVICGLAALWSVVMLAGQAVPAGQEYLGAPQPGDKPLDFPVAVDDGLFASERLAVSADGTEIYYSELNGWDNGSTSRIRGYRFDGKTWAGPANVVETGSGPILSMDDQTMYFQRKLEGLEETWYCTRTKSGWSEARQLMPGLASHYFCPTLSGAWYSCTPVKEGPGGRDIAVSAKGQKSLPFVSLGTPVNTTLEDSDFFVSPDESYVVLSTYGTQRVKNHMADLFISFHRPDGTWTEPVSLGKKINNSSDTRWGPWASRDGKFLFWCTGWTVSTGRLKWVRFDTLREELKKASGL